jgi:putative SOS response-associated peptidase YedK
MGDVQERRARVFLPVGHDRMPVIVQPKDYQRWLDPENEDVADILATPPSGLG